MFGSLMENGPPIVEYQESVHPVSVISRIKPVSRNDRRDRGREKRGRRPREHSDPELEDQLFEPFIGKLVDYTA